MAATVILEFEKPIIDLENKIEEVRSISGEIDISSEIKVLEKKVEQLRNNIYQNLTRWQRVQIARHPQRPITLDYINNCFTDFVELHGDRCFRDDPAIVGGIANLDGKPVMIVGQQKGRDTKTNIYRNFGMANPEGYRKALRLFKLAEKFNHPIINFLDTPGAACGLEAEERGQAEAIARNLFEMSKLKVPVVIVVIGEGASGGAIGIGVGDRILMLENAWYSVISPESCSSILWRSWDYKEQAAEALQLTSFDLKRHKIIDMIIKEPIGGAHRNPEKMYETMFDVLIKEVKGLSKVKPRDLIKRRREKFYNMGVWEEE
ncbi:acetyl-CoA carboxylase carboxyltransferase subunit alpha [Bacteroidota bacterium]